MEAKIKGTGNQGSMLNEIVLNAWDAMIIKKIVLQALSEEDELGVREYEIEKCKEYIKIYKEAFEDTRLMKEDILIFKNIGGK